MKTKLKAAVYDMDDLMINSSPMHVQAWDILKEYGHSLDEVPKGIRSGFVGLRIIDITKQIVDVFKLDVSVEELYRKRQELFARLVRESLDAMPGLQKSLDFFKSQEFRIALASSGTPEYIDFVLGKFKIKKYFEVIVSGADVDKGKPDPAPYLLACKRLGLPPAVCVVMEDAANGIAAAKAAGCRCIGVPSPHTPEQDLSKADLVLGSLAEIDKKSLSRI